MKLFQLLKTNPNTLLLLAGVGMTLGYAPFNAWLIALICMAYFFRTLGQAETGRQVAMATLFWGAGWQISGLYWLPRAFYLDADGSWIVGVFGGVPGMLAVAFWGTLWCLAVAYAAFMVKRRFGLKAFAVALPLLWVVMEIVRGMHQMGFPWFPLGAMWANWGWLAQGASVAGVSSLSFMLAGLAMVLAGGRRRDAVMVGVCVVVLAGAGALRMERGEAAQVARDRTVEAPVVRLVQPNEQSAMKWDPAYRWQYLQGIEALTFGPGWQLADALVLPENAVPFYLEQEVEARVLLTRNLLPDQRLATGTVGLEEGQTRADDRYYNRLSVLGAGSDVSPGEVVAKSGKVLLVPFGEYIPLRWVLDYLPIPGVRTLSQSRLDYTADTQPHLLDLGGAGMALPLVCYEAIFPTYVARHAAGADVLLNVTNDNWFTGTTALSQHAALARLRAIETGLPLIRVANTGISVVYDGYGREVARLPVNAAAVMDVRMPGKVETVWGTLWGMGR